MIYVPNFNENDCIILNNNTIEVYHSDNTKNTYFLNQHYNYISSIYNTYDSSLCINHNNLTTNYFYRNDLSHILVCVFILSIFLLFIPYKIFSRFFGRWLHI